MKKAQKIRGVNKKGVGGGEKKSKRTLTALHFFLNKSDARVDRTVYIPQI